jgi:hypothetical protein
MPQPELLSRVIQVLDTAGVEYMLTGSLASSIQGQPRSTHDIDLVVNLPLSAVPALVAAFPPPEFFLPEAAARDAIQNRSMFNLIVPAEDDKVDFWLLTDEPFDRTRFARRVAQTIAGQTVYLSSPEDTILAKLRWSRMSGGSEKQFKDALSVYEVQFGRLDLAYLEQWANTLSVQDLWDRLKAEAQPL